MASSGSPLPYSVDFLMLPNTPLDFFVTVGKPESNSMQRFGVDKWMLIARSKVLRVMLLESKLRHDKEFTITDLDPVTFKHFLVFLYGHDNTSTLKFEDAIKLLTAAEKYDVPDLKAKLGDLIQARVTSDNVFVALQEAPTCETVPALWETVTDILQSNTKEVFSHPQFLTASPQVVLHILQQDTLSVPEIDVWRATLSWAKCQDHPREDIISPQTLRSTLLPFLKHIRLCTLSTDHLLEEVISTEVLTGEESGKICQSVAEEKKCESLVNVCNDIVKRGSKVSTVKTCTTNGRLSSGAYEECTLSLTTNQNRVALCDVVCQANGAPDGSTYLCECSIMIRNTESATRDDTDPVGVSFSQTVESGGEIVIPMTDVGDDVGSNMVLKANTSYELVFIFNEPHRVYWYGNKNSPQVTDGFTLLSNKIYSLYSARFRSRYYGNHCKKLHYKIIT